ncbi:MAG TPA: CbtA family protein [Stellaceae bacterium]|nr:CbtA family protein [Stellaceae bacterium]
MVGGLLLRGMLVGVVAGLLCFGFLKIAGEPAVDRAIEFESTHAAAERAQDHQHENQPPEPELVSRETQAGIGLLTGVTVYSAAFGGLFALAFALAHRRIGDLSPRAVAALLATLGFMVVYAVPALKYPANPPSVGAPETIGTRTALYFGFVAVSLLTAIAAGMLRSRLQARHGAWNATLIAGGLYVAVMLAVGLGLPAVNEVPDGFPAVVLWQFRMSALGAQLIMWTTLGLVFGALTQRAVTGQSRLRAKTV